MGDDPKMIFEKLIWLCTCRVDTSKKMEWLKIWNFDKEFKHVASFLMDISNTKLLDAWMKKITFWWQVCSLHDILNLFALNDHVGFDIM